MPVSCRVLLITTYAIRQIGTGRTRCAVGVTRFGVTSLNDSYVHAVSFNTVKVCKYARKTP